MEVRTEGVPAQDVRTKIVHRQTGKLLVMNRERNGTMGLKEKREATGADGEFWSVVPLETGPGDVPTKVRLDCHLKQDGNVPYDLIPSKQYPGSFRFFYQGKMFIGHGGGPTGVSTTFGDLSGPELDKDIWYFEYTAPPKDVTVHVESNLSNPPTQGGPLDFGTAPRAGGQTKEYNFQLVARPFGLVVSKLGELLNHVRIKAEDKRITDSADVLKAAVQNLIKLLTDVGVVPAATLTALGSLSDALSTAATAGDSAGVGLTALKLLNMYGDVVEVVLGAAAGVVAGLGLALKNICYQLGCLVHQDLDSAGKSLKQLLQPMGLTPLMQSFDDALSRLNTAALAAPQDYDMIVLTVFTSFSLVINNVFRKVGNVSITVSNEVGRGSELQVLPPKEYNFELVSRPFGLVVSKLGELLNDVKRKAEEKRIRDSALVLDNAVDNLIKLLGGIGIVRTATLTEFGKLSDVLFTAVTSGDSVGVGITALKLLYMYGDVVETVLGAATGVVAGLGLGLKNICYQLGSLVHQDFAGAGKALTGLLEPMGLVPIMQSFDDALSRLNTAALAIPQDFDTIVLTVFTSFSLVINNVFRKVGTASITVPNGSGQGVSPSKIYNFELLSRPFGLVVSKLGELLNNVWRKADDKRIRDSAAVLDGAVDNLIKLLTDVGVVPAAMLTALGSLSDALFTAATSGNTVGVWVIAVELLNMYGDVVEVVFGAAAGVVDGLGLALKSICYQLGCLVQQDFESTAIALNTLLQPMGLGPIMQSLDDALSSLYTATLRLPQNYDMILLTAFSNFSVVIINVFRKVGNVSIIVPNEVGRGSEPQVLPPKEYNFELVSRPFGLVVSKLGELLNHVRIKAEKKRISDSALVLDNAVDNLIKLLAGIGIVPTAMLTEFGNLSDALSTAVTSGNSVGVGITALKLLNTYGNVVERVLGATPGVVDGLGLTLKSFCYELGSLVHQDFDGAGIALSGLLEPMGLGPIMQPFDEALSSLNRVALAFPQDYDMTVLTVFTSFSLVMNNVFRKVGTASIVNPGGGGAVNGSVGTGSQNGAVNGQTWPQPPPPHGATGSDFGTGQTWPPPSPPHGGTGSQFGTGPTWPQPPPPHGATGSDFGTGQTWPPPPPPPQGGTGSQFGTGPTWPQPPPPQGGTGSQFGTGQTWPPPPPPQGGTGSQFGAEPTWPQPPPPHGATGSDFGAGQTWPPTPPPHGATGNQFGAGQTWPAPPPPPGKGNPYEIPFGVKIPLGVPIDPYGNGGVQFQPGQPPSQSPHLGFGL